MACTGHFLQLYFHCEIHFHSTSTLLPFQFQDISTLDIYFHSTSIVILLYPYASTSFLPEESDRQHHGVEYRHSRVADIILQIGWETNTSHAELRQLDRAVNIKL